MLMKPLGRVRCIIVAGLLSSCAAEPEQELETGARVRVQARQLGTGWHTGSVGTVGGECMTVMVGEPPERPVRFKALDFADVAELLVSDRYDGLPGPDGAPRTMVPGADTTGEGWRKVDLEALRRKTGGCLNGFVRGA
jgi:hypothetical protein